MYNPAIAMLFGLLNTCLLNLAKAMERHGIEIFDQIRAKIKNSDGVLDDPQLKDQNIDVNDVKKPTIYIVGFILNQTPALWAMLSNMYSEGNSSYFTSMSGVGLIVLLIYSSKVLDEPVNKPEIIGAVVLIIGTLIIGIENIYRPEPTTEINLVTVWVFLIIYLVIGGFLMALSLKKGSPLVLGIVFGAFAGGCGALDPFFKSIAQNWGVEEAGFLPDITNPFAVIIFILSFATGTGSFLITQWGFARDADASVLVPSQTTTNILVPVFVYIITYPGEYAVYWTTVIGFALIIMGIILMQSFKQPRSFENIEIENVEEHIDIIEKE